MTGCKNVGPWARRPRAQMVKSDGEHAQRQRIQRPDLNEGNQHNESAARHSRDEPLQERTSTRTFVHSADDGKRGVRPAGHTPRFFHDRQHSGGFRSGRAAGPAEPARTSRHSRIAAGKSRSARAASASVVRHFRVTDAARRRGRRDRGRRGPAAGGGPRPVLSPAPGRGPSGSGGTTACRHAGRRRSDSVPRPLLQVKRISSSSRRSSLARSAAPSLSASRRSSHQVDHLFPILGRCGLERLLGPRQGRLDFHGHVRGHGGRRGRRRAAPGRNRPGILCVRFTPVARLAPERGDAFACLAERLGAGASDGVLDDAADFPAGRPFPRVDVQQPVEIQVVRDEQAPVAGALALVQAAEQEGADLHVPQGVRILPLIALISTSSWSSNRVKNTSVRVAGSLLLRRMSGTNSWAYGLP